MMIEIGPELAKIVSQTGGFVLGLAGVLISIVVLRKWG